MSVSQDLIKKLKKNSKIDDTDLLTKSRFFKQKKPVLTPVPMLNVALGGRFDSGITSGLTVVAGPSKHFKSSFVLLMISAYLREKPNAICLFYDSEFGTPQSYFSSFGIPLDRVVHTPIKNIEDLKFDIVSQMEGLEATDEVIIVIDSIGNLASKKEIDDAINEKSVADMTRAKALKGLFRMTTPYLTMKDIPLFAVNHTYMEQTMYPKAVVSGGCLVAGTEIEMFDGTYKFIDEVLEGELVATLEGPKEVTHTWNPETLEEGEPECFEIEFEDGFKVKTSNLHRFMVAGDWLEAQNLKAGDEVLVKSS